MFWGKNVGNGEGGHTGVGRFALEVSAQLDLRLAELWVSKNVPNWTKLSSSSVMDKKCMQPPPWGRWRAQAVMVHFSPASLSLSAHFPASWAGDVSSLFKSVSSATPAVAGGQRGGGRQWVRTGATHLPPAEVFYLLVFMSVLQHLGARWLLEEAVTRVAHHGRSAVFVFSGVSQKFWVKVFARIWPVGECSAWKSSVQMFEIW